MATFVEDDLTAMRERCDELADQCQRLMIIEDLADQVVQARRRRGDVDAALDRLEHAMRFAHRKELDA